jgi:hypothetical protein
MPEKTVKPKIEDVICKVLNGDAQKNALDFVAYLRENKLNPAWSAKNVCTVSSKTFRVCFIRLHGAADYHNLDVGCWNISPFIGEYEDDTLADKYKEIVWANKKDCQSCSQCALKLDAIFGKNFPHSCEGSILFVNPDTKTVECVKQLIALRRNEIKDGKARKHQYVAIKDR